MTVLKIVRKAGPKGEEADVATRGPFMTEATMFDGGRPRRLVVQLAGDALTIRYARSKRVLVHVGYDELVKRERARTWKVGPRRAGL